MRTIVTVLALTAVSTLAAASTPQPTPKQYLPEPTPGNPNPPPLFPPVVEINQSGLSPRRLFINDYRPIRDGRYSSLRTEENGAVQGYVVRVLPSAVELTICANTCTPVLRSTYTRRQSAIRFTLNSDGFNNAQVTMTPNRGSVDITIDHQGRQWSDSLVLTPD